MPVGQEHMHGADGPHHCRGVYLIDMYSRRWCLCHRRGIWWAGADLIPVAIRYFVSIEGLCPRAGFSPASRWWQPSFFLWTEGPTRGGSLYHFHGL